MKKVLKKLTFVISFMVIFVVLYVLNGKNIVRKDIPAKSSSGVGNDKLASGLVDTPGCRIPYLDVMHDDVKKYYKKLPTVPCASKKPLTYVQDGQLYIDSDVKQFYGNGEVRCCYAYIYRVTQTLEKHDKNADRQIRYGDCKAFNDTVNLTEDFVKVECTHAGKSVYKNMHASIPQNHAPKATRSPKTKPSVFIIGLDSVSRLNFRRQMPLTLSFLEQLGFIEYLGYNKIGDNTFPNLVALLTGRTVSEFKKICWQRQIRPVDDCPFVWSNFSSQRNYTTFYAEDTSIWGTFAMGMLGFVAPPTDFYYRPYALAVETLGNRSDEVCFGYEYGVEHVLDYTRAFATTHKDTPFFALSWGVRLGHNDLNEPQLADPLYDKLFNTLDVNGVLENAIVFVVSDHGLRFGEFRGTYLGYMEERLPMFWTRFPDWFNRAYPEAVANFRENAYKLTSPFDVHQTFLDLLDVDRLTAPLATYRTDVLHGQSLFTNISSGRTCREAGIDDTWCTCYQHVPIRVTHGIVVSASTFVVQTLNSWLVNATVCENLTLSHILEASVKANNKLNWMKFTVRKYVIRLSTVPGHAELEATVEWNVKLRKFSLMGQVSRLNRYDAQSSCMDDALLKLYCYCKQSSD